MHKGLMALALCGLLALTPANAAGTFTPVAATAHSTLDFDTADGSYSVWNSTDIAGLDAVRTTLQVHRFGTDPKWASTVLISLNHDKDWVGFRAARRIADEPLVLTLERHQNGTTTIVQTFTTRLALDDKLDLAVDWTADGTLTVRVGNETAQTTGLGVPFDKLQISNSTCDAEFTPLQIGRTD